MDKSKGLMMMVLTSVLLGGWGSCLHADGGGENFGKCEKAPEKALDRQEKDLAKQYKDAIKALKDQWKAMHPPPTAEDKKKAIHNEKVHCLNQLDGDWHLCEAAVQACHPWLEGFPLDMIPIVQRNCVIHPDTVCRVGIEQIEQ